MDPRRRRAIEQAQKSETPRAEKRLLRKRQYGLDPAEDARKTSVENARRLEEMEAQAADPAPRIIAPRPVGRARTPELPEIPTFYDRLHKFGRDYVVVSQDHFSGDDPYPNPAYAPENTASSIEDGYAKAEILATKGGSLDRVALIIWGGQWNEALDHGNPDIDIIGVGQPRIIGHSYIRASATWSLIEGITFENTGSEPACDIEPGTIIPTYRFPLLFRNCRFVADETPCRARRTVLWDSCSFEQMTETNVADEVACLEIGLVPGMNGFSKLKNCTVASYRTYTELERSRWRHWAIKVTAKTADPLSDGGYVQIPHTGVVLDNTEVYGGAIVEGWRLIHRKGSVHHGPNATDAGTYYALVRGWVLFNDSGAYGEIPGYVHFDRTSIYSSVAAIFKNDLQQSLPYVWGGTVWAHDVMHFGPHIPSGSSVPVVPNYMFENLSAVGYVHSVGSRSAAVVGLVGPGVALETDVDNITGINWEAMQDYYLQIV